MTKPPRLLDAAKLAWQRIIPAVGLIVMLGCATSQDSNTSPTTLTATGDPGVSSRVQSTAAGVPEQVATVPAELQFYGNRYDLRCVHGPQPGRLNLVALRNGMSISTGATTRPGEVTVFKIRPTEISVGLEAPAK